MQVLDEQHHRATLALAGDHALEQGGANVLAGEEPVVAIDGVPTQVLQQRLSFPRVGDLMARHDLVHALLHLCGGHPGDAQPAPKRLANPGIGAGAGVLAGPHLHPPALFDLLSEPLHEPGLAEAHLAGNEERATAPLRERALGKIVQRAQLRVPIDERCIPQGEETEV